MNGSPEERHDGNKGRQIFGEGANSFGSVSGAKLRVLNVSGNKKLVRCT